MLILFCFGLFRTGREYAPRVLSPCGPTPTACGPSPQFPRWRGLSGDALAWEVYKYLVDTRSGLFHCNEVLEGDDALSEYRNVRDPVKIINVYGYAYCGILGPTMAGVWEDMAGDTARTVSLPGCSHVVAEVFYGEQVALHGPGPAGRFPPPGRHAGLAGRGAARSRRCGTTAARCSSPTIRWISSRRTYEQTTRGQLPRLQPERPHDGLRAPAGRDLHALVDAAGRALEPPPGMEPRGRGCGNSIEQPPRGPKPNHRDFTIHNHGNGRFVYRPDLSDRSSDFADGAYDARNVRPAAAGLTLKEPGEG